MTRYDNTIICLMGPTASGKTQLALSLAETRPVEIISVDSVMVYRGMDIGSAKPDAATLSRFPHRLIDIRDPSEPYSAAEFCRDAVAAIHEIIANKKIPLLVGGTMLYFRALQAGLSELPSANVSVREKILAEAEKNGWPALHTELATIDPAAAARIHPHDSQRIQRALEVFRISGTSLTAKQKSRQPLLKNFQIIAFAVAPPDRAILHARIAQRFRLMLEQGLVAEVRRLFMRGDLDELMPAMRSAGYRQVWEYLSGKLSYEEMEQRGIISTRQLAKRQLTWLRHWPEPLKWFDSESDDLKKQVMEWLFPV